MSRYEGPYAKDLVDVTGWIICAATAMAIFRNTQL
jgi:hypothetical protein